jgi:hypothetical protein
MNFLPRKYSQNEVSLQVGPWTITGLADDGVGFAAEGERSIWVEGANGEIGVADRPTRICTMTINLVQTSADNGLLASVADQFLNVLMRDNFGGTIVRGVAKLETDPELLFAKELSDRAWVYKMAYEMDPDGNDPALAL